MRVLVTGGAGFIGSHVVRALLARGAHVNVLDDFSTGKRENLPASDDVEVIEGDVADPDAVRAALEDRDAFIHLAAVASVERSVQEPLATHRTNLQGSIQLFEAAARLGVKRGLYASSAAVYGDSTNLPLATTEAPRPLSPYAADKLAGEHYLAFYHRGGRLNATAFRFFNVFGPRQDPASPYSGVISIFLDRARRGSPITVYGDGEQTRDFVYVGDVVAALLAALDRQGVGPDAPSELPIYNVGRSERVSLLALLATIEDLPGVRSPLAVSHGPAREGDIRHSLADSTPLRTALGWQPSTTLADGLAAILDQRE
ncbi:MAG: NAD-dependent epimerase/dehydratase family protein [Trueperaceae bacterium]|nr:NAD-dependent epimerase/dehydratase family protein [Trueperaceae bacterium]MCW5818337.1 NAD-dependent epimerase/dehydratase family protein [Trueperaceae bacterium]